MTGWDPMAERVAIVTGAGTGTGRAVATKFGSLGWSVAVGGRRIDKLVETARDVDAAGGTGFPHVLDVTDAASVESFFAAVEAELGTADVVVSCAAVGRHGPLDLMSPEETFTEIATKLVGSLYVAGRAIRALRTDGTGGDLVFIASISAAQPWPFHVPYAAANAGVEHAARSLRLELEGTGIRVNVMRLGEIGGTEMAGAEQGSDRSAIAIDYWFRRGYLRHGQAMTTEMVADAVADVVTRPPTYQYDVLSVVPVAPMGELPATMDDLRNSYRLG